MPADDIRPRVGRAVAFLTSAGATPIMIFMWSPLRLLFVLLALSGLVGQTAVYAMAPVTTPAEMVVEVDGPSMDCAEMTPADEATMPCEGMTLDCIAKMGCLVSPAVAPLAGLTAHPVFYGRVDYLATRETASGLTVRPEIFPPIA